MTAITLPGLDGTLAPYTLRGTPVPVAPPGRPFTRVAYSAAHVVADPLSPAQPGEAAAIEWDATLRYRRHLHGLGLGIAEAMDTAQRGMGLGWPEALALIQRTAAELPDALLASGVGTDHLDPAAAGTVDAVRRAYGEQLDAVQRTGSRVILMASRALARVARGPEDYRRVYRAVLADAERPVILHWLGEMFDPALAGYWGAAGFDAALDTALAVIGENPGKVDGIKISLLDAEKERRMRRLLPPGVRMYTGDDFNYPELIAGDADGHSDALLGIFDPIAPAAAAALAALAAGDEAGFRAILDPTVPLSRRIFEAPTRFYKTGVVFLAYLNGHQDHFTMVGGAQAMRSLPHLAEVFRLADDAGLLHDPARAASRMGRILAVHGVGT